MNRVVLTSVGVENSNDDIGKAVTKAFEVLNFNFNEKIKCVVIKPNLCYYWDYSTGETTDPRTVSAVVDFIRDCLGKDVSIIVAEADASAMKTKYAFKALGYEDLSRTKNVQLVNLSNGNVVHAKVKVEKEEFVLPINTLLLNADLVINMPKIKTHEVIGFTCALKNMFGAIAKPRKYAYHKRLSHVIVAANKLMRSDVTIVDGIIARGSCPRKLGVIIAGDNPLATDFVAAEIAGFNPRRIRYLKMAEKEGIGNVNGIDIFEDSVRLAEIKNRFPSYNYFFHKLSLKLQLKLLQIYAAAIGDVIPPFLEE